jgi:two-component system chemotaxis response regulator CheB
MHKRKSGVIKIVLVDDSATSREMLLGLFQDSPDVQIVGTGFNGEDAVALVNRLHPDVVIMDIKMPKLDGLEATKRIMRENPTPIVLVSGSKMSKDVDLTFKALRAGALTVLDKPGMNDPQTCSQIVKTVRLMADVPVIHHWRTRDASIKAPQPTQVLELAGDFDLKIKEYISEIKVIGIAASTGGPAALLTVLRGLTKDFPLPILVVQHITEGFAGGLARWLKTNLSLEVVLASEREMLKPGKVYLAPDDFHLQVDQRSMIQLTKDAAYKGLRPSANNLFASMAHVFGHHAFGIILTGMGDDGANGAVALHAAHGLVVVQDEQSSVVYGMPREIKMRNAADYVLNLEQIASLLSRFDHSNAGSIQVGKSGETSC